jgi:hypothetical protein
MEHDYTAARLEASALSIGGPVTAIVDVRHITFTSF